MQIEVKKPDTKIYCNDGCKRGVEPEDLSNAGWSWLPITNRYRCVDCWRALREANAPKEPQ